MMKELAPVIPPGRLRIPGKAPLGVIVPANGRFPACSPDLRVPVSGGSPNEETADVSVKKSGCDPSFTERFAFGEKAEKAYAAVHTGETETYGGVILCNGGIPSPAREESKA